MPYRREGMHACMIKEPKNDTHHKHPELFISLCCVPASEEDGPMGVKMNSPRSCTRRVKAG